MNEIYFELAALAVAFLAMFGNTFVRVGAVVLIVGVIAYRNRAFIASAWRVSRPATYGWTAGNAAPAILDPDGVARTAQIAKPQGFVSIVALGTLASIASAAWQAWAGVATAATAAGSVMATVAGAIPALLAALDRPIVAATVFGLMGLAVGYGQGETAGKVDAVDAANRKADAAIMKIDKLAKAEVDAVKIEANRIVAAAHRACPAPPTPKPKK